MRRLAGDEERFENNTRFVNVYKNLFPTTDTQYLLLHVVI